MDRPGDRIALVTTLEQACDDGAAEITTLLRALGLVRDGASHLVTAILAAERARSTPDPSFARRAADALEAASVTTPRAAEPDPGGRCAELQVRRFRAGLSRRRCGTCAAASIALWTEGGCPRCESPREEPPADAAITVCASCASREPAGARACERCGDWLTASRRSWPLSPERLREDILFVTNPMRYLDDVALVTQLHHDVVELFEAAISHPPEKASMLIPLADRLAVFFDEAGPAAPHVHLGPARLWRLRRALWKIADRARRPETAPAEARQGSEPAAVPGVADRAERLLLAIDAAPRPATIEEARAALRDAIRCAQSTIADHGSYTYKDDSMDDVLLDAYAESQRARQVLDRHDPAGRTLAEWLGTLDAEWERASAHTVRAGLRGLWDGCPA